MIKEKPRRCNSGVWKKGYPAPAGFGSMCEKVGIPARGMHALRRVYISTLIDAGFNINTIRAQVGHADERTTYKSYCYDRKPKEIKQEEFEKTLKIFPQPA